MRERETDRQENRQTYHLDPGKIHAGLPPKRTFSKSKNNNKKLIKLSKLQHPFSKKKGMEDKQIT